MVVRVSRNFLCNAGCKEGQVCISAFQEHLWW